MDGWHATWHFVSSTRPSRSNSNSGMSNHCPAEFPRQWRQRTTCTAVGQNSCRCLCLNGYFYCTRLIIFVTGIPADAPTYIKTPTGINDSCPPYNAPTPPPRKKQTRLPTHTTNPPLFIWRVSPAAAKVPFHSRRMPWTELPMLSRQVALWPRSRKAAKVALSKPSA